MFGAAVLSTNIGRSMVGAVVQLIDNFVNDLGKGKNVLATLRDLTKAFDRVSAHILIRKLEPYDMRNCVLALF